MRTRRTSTIPTMPRAQRAAAFAILLVACHRLADMEEETNWREHVEKACAASCAVFDECDPGRFETESANGWCEQHQDDLGCDPERHDDCYLRCVEVLPWLTEENQCASRGVISQECIGTLTCDEFWAWSSQGQGDPNAKCAFEYDWTTKCDPKMPFDLDEPVPDH